MMFSKVALLDELEDHIPGLFTDHLRDSNRDGHLNYLSHIIGSCESLVGQVSFVHSFVHGLLDLNFS